MKLEEIGFYSLSDERACNSTIYTDLIRCEVILTDKCNFKCPYCRGSNNYTKGTLSFDRAKYIVDIFGSHNIQNIRFSGGEVTMLPYLEDLIKYTRRFSFVKRIAISTNGSADFELYKRLYEAGVNDFSISFDACCTSTSKVMAGGIDIHEKIKENIKKLSELTYVTVGVVVDENNISEVEEIIELASTLNVSDIRIIPAAQFANTFENINISSEITERYKILKYRIDNLKNGKTLRGLEESDSRHCYLGLDDMVIAGNYHFPCVIYMREGGAPVGTVDMKTMSEIRRERLDWIKNNNCRKNSICSRNCLDVCRDFNNLASKVVYEKNILNEN